VVAGAEVQNTPPGSLAGSLTHAHARAAHPSTSLFLRRPDQHQLPFCLSLSLLTISRRSPPVHLILCSRAQLAYLCRKERKAPRTQHHHKSQRKAARHQIRSADRTRARSELLPVRSWPALQTLRPGARKVREPLLDLLSPCPFLPLSLPAPARVLSPGRLAS
jgi:hypothetical protein